MDDNDVYYGTLHEHDLEILRDRVIISLQLNDMVKCPSGKWCRRPPAPRNN